MSDETESVEMTEDELQALIQKNVAEAMANMDEIEDAEIEKRVEQKLNELFRGGTLVVMSPDEFRRTLAEAFASEVKTATESALTRVTGNPGLFK